MLSPVGNTSANVAAATAVTALSISQPAATVSKIIRDVLSISDAGQAAAAKLDSDGDGDGH